MIFADAIGTMINKHSKSVGVILVKGKETYIYPMSKQKAEELIAGLQKDIATVFPEGDTDRVMKH